MPTLVDQWIERGLEQGREEGQRDATINLLRRSIHYRFSLPLNHFDSDLAALDLAALMTLSDRVFDVADQTELEDLLTTLKSLPAKNDD